MPCKVGAKESASKERSVKEKGYKAKVAAEKSAKQVLDLVFQILFFTSPVTKPKSETHTGGEEGACDEGEDLDPGWRDPRLRRRPTSEYMLPHATHRESCVVWSDARCTP